MINCEVMTLDELSCLALSLQTARREHSDLDLPLLEEMYDKVTAELEKRN